MKIIHVGGLFAVLILLLITVSCENRGDKNHIYLTNFLKEIDSVVHTRDNPFNEADIRRINEGFATAKNVLPTDMAEKYIRHIYYYAGSTTALDSAMLYADSAANILQNKVSDEKLSARYVRVLLEKANIYLRVKKYDEALRNYTTARVILNAHAMDSTLLYAYYHGMGNIFFEQRKYLQAARIFRLKTLIAGAAIKKPFSAFYAVQENMDNTGISYFKAGMTDSAVYFYNATLDYINAQQKNFPEVGTVQFDIARGVVYSNLAPISSAMNDFAGAEKLFLKSIESTKEYKDSIFNRSTQIALAQMYLTTNQDIKAGNVLKHVIQPVDSSEISSSAASFYDALFTYYTKTKDSLAAYQALLHSYKTRDLLEQKEKLPATVDVQREFESKEQRVINQALSKDNAIKNNYLLIAIATAIMIFIIVLLVWRNLKRKSAFVIELTALNGEVREKNQDMQKAFKSLELSHNENNRIMRVVAHDLKNPISAIRILVHSLLKREQGAEKKEILELIQTTCSDSMNLINDLLNKNRPLSDISKELVDMGRLIEQCTELLKEKANEKNQSLKIEVDHQVVLINRQKMWRVFSNIVGNAIKFSPSNAEITIRLTKTDNHLLFSVHDNGIGIPGNLKDKIFTIDPDKSRVGTAGEKSYGLGLSISMRIIEEHDGRLWFESEDGKGSVFYVELPYSAN